MGRCIAQVALGPGLGLSFGDSKYLGGISLAATPCLWSKVVSSN